jgi:hypothetical protein
MRFFASSALSFAGLSMCLVHCGGTTVQAPAVVDAGPADAIATTTPSEAGAPVDAGAPDTSVPKEAASDAASPSGSALTFGSCPAFAGCEGNIVGSWKYTGGCIEDALVEAKQGCPDLVVANIAGTIDGTLTVGDSTLERDVTAVFTAKVQLPASCTQGAPCAFVGPGLKQFLPNATATCTGSGACDCDVVITRTEKVQTTYTLAGTTLTTQSGEVYEVCAENGKFRHQQTAGTPLIAGVYEASPK